MTDKRQIRLLIFEDDLGIQNLFKKIVQDRGYEVFCFTDPSTCPLYDYTKCHCSDSVICTDIIISDIKMPNVDGISFIKGQVEKGCSVNVKNIIVVSGYWTEESTREAIRLGVKTLLKPFKIKELNEWLDGCEKRIDFTKTLMQGFKVEY